MITCPTCQGEFPSYPEFTGHIGNPSCANEIIASSDNTEVSETERIMVRKHTQAEGGDRKPIVEFWDGSNLVARCFETYHPSIPWEVYVYTVPMAVKRVMTIDEAEQFIQEQIA